MSPGRRAPEPRGAFEELVMGKSAIHDSIMVQDSNGSVKEVVATDPYAIGYISLGVVDSKVRALSVGGVAPTTKNILAKKYRIVRPFLYLTSGEPGRSAKHLHRLCPFERRTGNLEKRRTHSCK